MIFWWVNIFIGAKNVAQSITVYLRAMNLSRIGNQHDVKNSEIVQRIKSLLG